MSAGIWLADRGVAFVLLPVYVPMAVLILEPPGWRRATLWLLAGAGAISSADYFVGLQRGDGSATTMG